MELSGEQLLDMEKIKEAFFKFINWQYCGLLIIVLFSLIMHLSVITQPSDGYIFDETYYINDAHNITDNHTTDRPEHPPLAKLIIVSGIQVFGDNPIGWRLLPILFGTANLILLYFICRQLKLSEKVSLLAVFLLALENLNFLISSTDMLDVYSLFFMLLAFWLYLKDRFFLALGCLGLAMLAKMTGALGAAVIGLHWLFSGHRKPLRFLLSIYMVPIVFFLGLFLCDSFIHQEWINPFTQFTGMMSGAGDLTFENYSGGWEAYPWLWIFVPQNPTFFGTDTIRWQGLINPTLLYVIIPVFGYLIYRFIKKEREVLFSLMWFCGTYLMWIPIVLITDRLTYYFYFYSTIGAVAIGAAIVLSQLTNKHIGKWIATGYLLGHAAAFIILSPIKLWLSIPLCLILLAFILWHIGIFKKIPPKEAAVISDIPSDIPVQIAAEIQVDNQLEQ
ncbi:MAG: glycosyltransferase family 39 protein [Dehalococcoidales bacterium]|nr:glycosyltransferase family 39 protein [Dehalococcoidales bacterium]